MTEKTFAELTVQIWRLRQQRKKLLATIAKTGLVIQRRGQYRAAPAVAKLIAVNRKLYAAALEAVR